MTKQEKTTLVDELSEKLASNQNFYIADASGMSVAETNAFRRKCYENEVEYKVYKNTMIKKALDKLDDDYSDLDNALKGFSGVIFSGETANLPAKLLKDFRKKQGGDKPSLKAASISAEIYLGDENLEMLSALKSKNELIGDVIALLQSPAKNVISALQSGKHTVAGIVKTLAEREN